MGIAAAHGTMEGPKHKNMLNTAFIQIEAPGVKTKF